MTALAGELDAPDQDHDGPSTATEHRLAAAWAEVLGIPKHQIGRRDHFFNMGGTSLSVVRLAITLDRVVSLKDVTDHPILADLAALIEGRSAIDPGGSAPADPPTRSLAGTPGSPLRSRELARFARSSF